MEIPAKTVGARRAECVVLRVPAILLLFCLALTGTAIAQQSKSRPAPSGAAPAMDPKIVLGRTYLKLGDLEKARSNCEAAPPTQATEAQNCLSEVVQAQTEAKLRDFEGKVELGKREDAVTAALAVPQAALTGEQKKRFDNTLDQLRDLTLAEAQAKLPGKKDEAAILATGVKFLSPSPAQRKKATDILSAGATRLLGAVGRPPERDLAVRSSCRSCSNSGRFADPVSVESFLEMEGQV